MTNDTLDFYEKNAEAYFVQTKDISVDLDSFLAKIPPGGRILDAGCGSGRDSRAFVQRGYKVDAIDGSGALAEFASEYAGIPVKVCRFQDFVGPTYKYDGIFASASLLHVPPNELPAVLKRLVAALAPKGVLWATFKYGRQTSVDERHRFFNNMTPQSVSAVFSKVPLIGDISCIMESGGSSAGNPTQWVTVCATRRERTRVDQGNRQQ